ncbi:MAG: TadE/TadG family type IV pilus assembly protein [Sphingomicrobium sp.]
MTRRLFLDRTGASAAEFALVLPLLILLLFGMIDTGRYMWEFNRAEKATQMGARFAVVTDVISSGLGSQSYVGVGGLTQGDLIPATALSPVTCTSAGCSCAGACPTNVTSVTAGAFGRVAARMRLMKSDIADNNVTVEYRGSGLGYAGDPNGMEVAPLVTVKLSGLQFRPLSLLMTTHFTMPDFATTLTSEDSSGTASN